MTRDALASKLSAYGVLASMSLPVIHRIDRNEPLELDSDDRERIEYLREILAASWQGAKLKGELNPRFLLKPPSPGGIPSTNRKLADHTVISGIVPDNSDFRTFVRQANKSLANLLRRPTELDENDREFLLGSFKEFLQRLSASSEPASASRRMTAQRIPLA
jgi:hypothetical protein